MARIDYSVENKWIPEEHDSEIYQKVVANSAVERVARRVPMSSLTKYVHSLDIDEVDVLAEEGDYEAAEVDLGAKLMVARKWGKVFPISEEDLADGIVKSLDVYKNQWFTKYALKFDNACLGTTAAPNSAPTSGKFAVPYESVYKAAKDAGNVIETAGPLTFDLVNDAIHSLEDGAYYDGSLSVIAHPGTRAGFRNLRDGNDNLVVSGIDAVSTAGITQIFGHQMTFSHGARTSAAATDRPTGNRLVIIGAANAMVLGDRSGPESVYNPFANWRTDVPELKVRARKGFVVAQPEAFVVIEVTS